MRGFFQCVLAATLLLSQAYAADTTPVMPPPPAAVAAPATSQQNTVNTTIVAFGDSIFSGYDLRTELAFPSKLERALREKGYGVQVMAKAVSGDTSADGLARVDDVIALRPNIVILEFGGNDLLRGIQPDLVKANLDQIMYKLSQAGAWIILVGQRAPLNYGKEYAEKFNGMYTELAGRYGVPLHPSVLDGVIGKPAMLLSDGVHPNALGVDVIVHGILPLVEQVLNKR